LDDAGIQLSTMTKGGSNGMHLLSSADLTDTADLPELHIEPDIDFVDGVVWIYDDEVPNPYTDYPLH
jgi:hypothetical protein